jgi:hypothetical protein
MSAVISSYLEKLVGRRAHDAVSDNGVLRSDPSNTPHGPENLAAEMRPERPQQTADECDPRLYRRSWANFR